MMIYRAQHASMKMIYDYCRPIICIIYAALAWAIVKLRRVAGLCMSESLMFNVKQ